MISSARPTSRRNTRPDALANKTSSVSPHAHGGRMTLFPWINPITREAPYSRESRSSCKHTCAVTAQTPKFRRRITGGTPGNVKLLLPPRQSRGNSQYISAVGFATLAIRIILVFGAGCSGQYRRWPTCGLNGVCNLQGYWDCLIQHKAQIETDHRF